MIDLVLVLSHLQFALTWVKRHLMPGELRWLTVLSNLRVAD